MRIFAVMGAIGGQLYRNKQAEKKCHA